MGVTTMFREGDWVSGTSSMDEKFIGYVESMNLNGVVKVWVTQCDLESTIGTWIEVELAKVKRLPDSSPQTPDELRDLIELALMTHDREWFQELSAKLNSHPINPAVANIYPLYTRQTHITGISDRFNS